jgi:RNA recognition motif-containing protein
MKPKFSWQWAVVSSTIVKMLSESSPSQIRVENLSYFCTENDLLQHFNSYLPVVDKVEMFFTYKDDGDRYPLTALVTLKSKEHKKWILRQFHGTLFMGKFLL